MDNPSFKLKDMRDIFKVTDPTANAKGDTVFMLPTEKLFPFKSHPFKLYSEQRFDDMVESVKANGILLPIIVRPLDDFNYEILSGHNRVEAAKAAGLENVPAIVRDGLSDDEALLVVTETNLIQRSFADLSHSERALTLSMHHGAIKKQGRRSDLIKEIENMLEASNINDSGTLSPMVTKLRTDAKLAQDYGLDRGTVARYLRVSKLIDALKERLDNGEVALRAAVTISYIPREEQEIIEDILDSSHYKLDMKKADALRNSSAKKPLDHETVEQILSGTKKPRATRAPAFKLKPKIVSRFFTPEQKADEIEATIIEALDFFYAHKKKENGEE